MRAPERLSSEFTAVEMNLARRTQNELLARHGVGFNLDQHLGRDQSANLNH